MTAQLERYIDQLRQQFEGKRAGMFASVFRWSWIEIADFRKRQPGDQQKRVNRKLSAKHDQLRVNEYDADRTIDVELFLDINQNRWAGIEQQNIDLVLLALTDFLVYAKKHQLRCVISRYMPELREYSITYDVQQVRVLFQQLIADVKQLEQYKAEYTSSLHSYLQQACDKRKKRICVIRSDFLDRNEQDTKYIAYLQEMHIQAAGIRLPVEESVGENYTLRTTQETQTSAILPIRDI